MQQFVALIHKEAGSDYGVSFPDFPGCVTAGTDLDNARVMAEEALALHIEGMIEDGEPIPPPSSLDGIMTERENRDAVAVLVPAPEKLVRSVRVNITMPEDILQEVDRFAQDHGFTRSGFLVTAARQMMETA